MRDRKRYRGEIIHREKNKHTEKETERKKPDSKRKNLIIPCGLELLLGGSIDVTISGRGFGMIGQDVSSIEPSIGSSDILAQLTTMSWASNFLHLQTKGQNKIKKKIMNITFRG